MGSSADTAGDGASAPLPPTRRPPPGRKGGLGRGLSALIPSPAASDQPAAAEVALDVIEPNPYQPRATLDDERLQELATSIQVHGVIQPLIVTRSHVPNRYVLIAGERRWRAARLAGLNAVPIVIKEAAPRTMLELALVENVVRADLSPLEEANAYRQLIDEFGLTQASVAERVGRSRVSVTNTLRLLAAPEQVQVALNAGTITEGHARALLGLPTAADQVAALDVVVVRGLTVRQTEDLVRRFGAEEAPQPATVPRASEETHLEDRFRRALGTKVNFKRSRSGGGSLTVHYDSDEQLNALYERLIGEDSW